MTTANAQVFPIHAKVRTSPRLRRYAGQDAIIVDYGYHMTYNRETDRQERRYDYAIIIEGGEHDGAAFRIRGTCLEARP